MNVLGFGKDNRDGRAALFLHGFPGVRSKQNRDLAERAANEKGRRCYVPLYTGLGHSEGEFSFLKCRDEVYELADKLISQNGSIDLVGHSWGGYLSLGLAALHVERVQTLVLMSPLVWFFTKDICQQAFGMTAKDNADLNLGNTDERAHEFFKLGNLDCAEEFARRISTQTTVSLFQAATDDTTPVSYAEALVNQFKKRPRYEVVNTDHSFLLDREQALTRVLTAL